MTHPINQIYLGSILFEKNCWTEERDPSICVSEWINRTQRNGYTGVELWSPHAHKASPEELHRLAAAAPQIRIFNGYAFLEPEDREQQDSDAHFAELLGCWALKYNVGTDPSKRATYLEELIAWRNRIPYHITMICECHIGSIVDTPQTAKAFFEEADLSNHGFIIHPFVPFGHPGEWLEVFGPQILHAHVQTRDANDRMAMLTDNFSQVREVVSIIKSHGYYGNYTMEFTRGSGFPEQSPETLYANGLEDLRALSDLLT